MKKFLLTLIVTMLTCIGAWAQSGYEVSFNGSTATVTSGSKSESEIVTAITNQGGITTVVLPSGWTTAQLKAFADQIAVVKTAVSKTVSTKYVPAYYYDTDVEYTGERGSDGTHITGIVPTTVPLTKTAESYTKKGSDPAEVYTGIVFVKGGKSYGIPGDVEPISITATPDVYTYNSGASIYDAETYGVSTDGKGYINSTSQKEIYTKSAPSYKYTNGNIDYLYEGNVYQNNYNAYYAFNDVLEEVKCEVVSWQYSKNWSLNPFSGTPAFKNGKYYGEVDGEEVEVLPNELLGSNGTTYWTNNTPYRYDSTGDVYVRPSTFDGANQVSANDGDVKYYLSETEKCIYKESTDGKIYVANGHEYIYSGGQEVALTFGTIYKDGSENIYTGMVSTDGTKGLSDESVAFELSSLFTYSYVDPSDNLEGDDKNKSFNSAEVLTTKDIDRLVYLDETTKPVPGVADVAIYVKEEGALTSYIDAMTAAEKTVVQSITIEGALSGDDAGRLSGFTSAKVFDVTNATGSLGNINVSGVVVASNTGAAAITTRTNLTAVVTPVDATTVDMVKGYASTIDAEALEMALAGKQTVNIKNPDANSDIVHTSLIDKLPSNITKVSIADTHTFGAKHTEIVANNTNITEFDASNVRGAYAKLTLDLSACTGLTTVNLVNSLLPESENVIGTLTLPNKPLTVMCTAAEKARVKALIGDDSNITYVIPAVKLAVSIADGLSVNHDKTIELSVIESAITVEATGYDALVKGTDYSLVVKQNGTVVPAEGLDASTFDNGEHSVSLIPFTVEVTSLNSELYTDADVANGSIALTHKKSFTLALSFENSKTSISANNSETAQILATSKDGETDVNVEYTYKSSDESVATVNTTTGLVTAVRGSSEPVTITVTATPIGDDAANYAPMTETISIEVTQSWVTLSKETIDGKEYVVVNVPVGGAFGPISDEPTTWKSATENPATLNDLKAAANVKVTGNLANSDVQELVHLIGGTHVQNGQEDDNTSVCLTLDMGDATMTEAITSNGTKCSFVSDDYKYMGSATSIVLPKPATGVTGGTVLPANMNKFFTSIDKNQANDLETLVIPEGWTEVKGDFSSYNFTQNETFNKLTTLKLPNSLMYIGDHAFAGLHVKVLDMPLNIKRIDAYAFNTCSKLQDVYFYGDAPEFVHTNAFAGVSQMANNTVDDNALNGKVDPVITRQEYANAGVLACILHYPISKKAQYVDMTRVYEVIPANQAYSKGNSTGGNKYFPFEGTDNEWNMDVINTVVNTLKGMNGEDGRGKADPSAGYDNMRSADVDYGVKDAYYGYSFIWPSQQQMSYGFCFAQAGYQWNGQKFDEDTQYNPDARYDNGLVDKRGLYQFIVAMSNSEVDFKFEQDKWYTISLNFNMSPEEIKTVFGKDTQVCRFSKAIREVVETDDVSKKILKLEFRNSVMCENDGRPVGTSYQADRLTDAGTYTGIRHHYPYMIKPSGTVQNKYIEHGTDGKWHFYGVGFDPISGYLEDDNVAPVNSNGTSAGVPFVYTFSPVLMQGKFKPYSYALRERKTATDCIHEYVFYRGERAKDKDGNDLVDTDGYYVYTDGGTANQNTAYVQLTAGALGAGADKNYGVEDYKVFFPAKASSGSPESGVKAVKSLFGDDVDDATEIDEVVIVCGTDEVGDNKVYTIGGQLVNGNSLPSGLYIKNGKKFIVK